MRLADCVATTELAHDQSIMSSSTQDRIPQLDLGSTFGALFIGVTIAALLFGVTNVQAFIYFQTHRDTGRTFYKLVVICLWILDALHLALIVHCVYHYLVIDYANIGALTEIVWSFKLQVMIDALIIYAVYVLYFYRIWIINNGRSKALPITVGIIVILTLGVGIVVVWDTYQSRVFTDLIRTEWATYMTFGTTTFVDIVIASSLCYLLATSRTGFSSTDSLITRLLGYIVGTGCLTSICSMAVVITCAVMPNNFIFLGVDFLVAKLYVNSFLALLNARYYVEPNADDINYEESNIRHDVYCPNLHIRTSRDADLQLSGKNMFKNLDDEVRYPTRSVQVVMQQRPIDD
ncbi:hypothetical protein DFH29DRAFT_257379 [Suillus ampliporus]|nr:hypothetical protein DFH29DRAFT_257379 [Suillus ampliporus]